MPAEASPKISLHLLDHSDGRSLQIWTFDDVTAITIGRDEDQSIVLADPYVSRTHAELQRNGVGWELVSKGRNGVLVDGKTIASCLVDHGTVFRLGPNGPAFRFENDAVRTPMQTLSFNPESMVVLQLNRQQLDEQTREVVETDFFQQLRDKARELRRQHCEHD
jgi:pSer/pThr/pTyr-binding forkhead associated (FHA) protein